ncbi:MAG: hypothetical protein Q8R00_02490 [Candidatus Nanoarchaeia archaeon]|nr:hypothetical protein [Candidatus Nanoarchaeia archaeon]
MATESNKRLKKRKLLSDEDLITLLEKVAGNDAVKLVTLIRGKFNVSEFKIAEKLGLTVNQVRNILYRLQDHNLVDFTRKKDKKKGWYIYFWTFVEEKAEILALKVMRERKKFLDGQLVREADNLVFSCPRKCIRCSFENAMELNFSCPECESILDKEDTLKKMNAVRKELEELKIKTKELEIIEKPIEVIPVKKKEKKEVKKIVKKAKVVKKVVKKKVVKKVEKKQLGVLGKLKQKFKRK